MKRVPRSVARGVLPIRPGHDGAAGRAELLHFLLETLDDRFAVRDVLPAVSVHVTDAGVPVVLALGAHAIRPAQYAERTYSRDHQLDRHRLLPSVDVQRPPTRSTALNASRLQHDATAVARKRN